MKLLADASLPQLASLFSSSFQLTLYDNEQQLRSLMAGQDILLCRSTLKVNATLLKGSQIQCVATSSSGVDHIDHAFLQSQEIKLIDAKGSNARAVADYVIATVAWLQSNNRLTGLRAGVVGVGKVGGQVVTRLNAAGFQVVGYDPLLDDHQGDFATIFDCDLICIHANLHGNQPFPSKNLFNAEVLQYLKPNAVIINASRGGIVNEGALLALPDRCYCTDVYVNEPDINPQIIDYATLCTPHIAGHSIEAKQNGVIQVSQELHRCYGFPMPNLTDIFSQNTDQVMAKRNWQETILSIYNPEAETRLLKESLNKQEAFLIHRRAHIMRHDFNTYQSINLNTDIKKLL